MVRLVHARRIALGPIVWTLLLAALVGLGAGSAYGAGTWSWQNPLPQGNALRSVTFIDAATGWAVGDHGTILHTDDGGATWNAQISGTTVLWLTAVTFTDANTGWVVGGDGTILHTVDGGVTWTAQTSGTTAWLMSVAFIDADTGWAVGMGGHDPPHRRRWYHLGRAISRDRRNAFLGHVHGRPHRMGGRPLDSPH